MTSKLKVNLINDSGDNNLITSDGSGVITSSKFKIGQIQSATFTDNLSTSSTSYVASTITDTITPTSTSSKILILINGGRSSYGGGECEGSSQLYYQVGSGSFNSITDIKKSENLQSGSFAKTPLSFNFVHSPNSTSALSYKVYYKTNANTYYLNSDTSNINITLMEILP
tara:strand:- start:161 stop:670 length:510 start_codon:yes stop_codon:yes gene_type:complete